MGTLADKMRLFKKKPFQHQDMVHMEVQGEVATATRALYVGPREMNRVEINIRVSYGKDKRTGEAFDVITVDMDLTAATELCQQLLHTVDTAAPRMPRSAARGLYGE